MICGSIRSSLGCQPRQAGSRQRDSNSLLPPSSKSESHLLLALRAPLLHEAEGSQGRGRSAMEGAAGMEDGANVCLIVL